MEEKWKKKTKEAEEEPKTSKSVIEQFASEVKNMKSTAAKMQVTAIETQKARLAEMQKSVNTSVNQMQAALAELQRTFKTHQADFMKDVAGLESNIPNMQEAWNAFAELFLKDVGHMKENAKEMTKHIWGPYPAFTKITSILGAATK